MELDQRILALTTTALVLKFYVTTTIQGGKRFKGGSRPPEDAKLSLNPKGKNQGFLPKEDDHPASKKAVAEDLRWQRIVLNDLENIPIGLAVGFVSVYVGANKFVNSLALLTFCGARIAHSYAYANQLQPHRAMFWFLGVASVLTLGINASAAALFH
ncbi:hypothetical protein EDD86DRAFT_267095 [Gorgonomyces haynaldii]|nr:hypothetical protein EDD86DRAFT_267095 [Gorgonomyces haynaldii]